jgi:hypothetical protein
MLTTKGGVGMFDLDEIRGAIRGKLDEMIRLQSEQDKQRSEATALAKAAEGRESGLTTDERDRITKAQAELVERGKTLNALNEELRGLRDRESEVEADTARRRDMEKLAGQYGGTARTASLDSVREPEIYRKGSPNSFFADMAFRFQDPTRWTGSALTSGPAGRPTRRSVQRPAAATSVGWSSPRTWWMSSRRSPVRGAPSRTRFASGSFPRPV